MKLILLLLVFAGFSTACSRSKTEFSLTNSSGMELTDFELRTGPGEKHVLGSLSPGAQRSLTFSARAGEDLYASFIAPGGYKLERPIGKLLKGHDYRHRLTITRQALKLAVDYHDPKGGSEGSFEQNHPIQIPDYRPVQTRAAEPAQSNQGGKK